MIETSKDTFVDSIWFVFIIAGLFVFPLETFAEDSLCAEVKIEIKQELSLERQAFDAHMRIHNGLSETTLENINVEVIFSDAEGNPVLPSFDPGNTDAKFFIRVDTMENIDDVSGLGTIAPSTTADIHWLIIPAPGSGGEAPQGLLYYIGANLTYSFSNEEQITRVSPDYIFVKPMPELTLDYFLPYDVYGDDAFTPEIEPLVPFSFGVRIQNTGFGKANSLSIKSAQPEITENEQKLLVNFVILGSSVQGQDTIPSLLADFGDIDPNACKTARWIMTSSLSGRFEQFTASYTHSDELGGELTSLIQDIHTHRLVKDVLVDLPLRDSVNDFLVKLPAGYKVYESENIESDVTDFSDSSTLTLTGTNEDEQTYSLVLPAASGFIFTLMSDPNNGTKQVKQVIRSDGKIISTHNAWFSKTREGTSEWSYFFNIFDVNSTGSYTIVVEDPDNLPQPPVLQYIPDTQRIEGEFISFLVIASDPDGTIPSITASNLPFGAVFTDNGNGQGIFQWTPVLGQAGDYSIVFTASDGLLEVSTAANLKICPVIDSDCDGMDDQWELDNFGNLDRDGTGDADEDGISDLDEFLNNLNPLGSDNAPSVPEILSPSDHSEVLSLMPQLKILNSTDADDDTITYDFELFSDEEYTLLVEGQYGVDQAEPTTGWTISQNLEDNKHCFWRVRATDGFAYSLWTYGNFFVNTVNDIPKIFRISMPSDGLYTDSLHPVLEVTNSHDPDLDELTYKFEVYSDIDLTTLVAASSDIAQGTNGSTSWQLSSDLDDATTYYWTGTAKDEHGGSQTTPVSAFSINTQNTSPTPPQITEPGAGVEINTLSPELIVTNGFDAEGDSLVYYFEIDKTNTFDSPDLAASEAIAETPTTTVWAINNLDDNTSYYWRVKASDGLSESTWTLGLFFTNTINEAPAKPSVKNPGEGAWVNSVRPLLSFNNTTDPDTDILNYNFEIYANPELTHLVYQAQKDTSYWQIETDLENFSTYYYRCQPIDEHGVPGLWTQKTSFFIKQALINESCEITLIEPSVSIVANTEDVLISWTDEDPDSNALISIYYDIDNFGEDGTLILDGIFEDPDGTDDSFSWNITDVPEGTYYIYAVISDANSSDVSYSPAQIFVSHNSVPDMPSSPEPENDAVKISIITGLAWTGSDPDPSDTLSYTLYFGTNQNALPLAVQDIDNPSFQPTDLAYDTQYFWQVISKDSYDQTSQGPIWNFTTFSESGDEDQDNLLNSEEIAHHTNPFAWDSDGDGYGDYEEINSGTDPNDVSKNLGKSLTTDLDGDSDVDGADLSHFLTALGTSTGQPGFLSEADFNNDGNIDSLDLDIIARAFGRNNIQKQPPEVDLDDDFDVDGIDLKLFLSSFGSSSGDQNFLSRADFNNDGNIDIVDLNRIASAFGMVFND
jgi:Ca2+-binding EF-hand superfamily protein